MPKSLTGIPLRHPAAQWARRVLNGRQVVGKLVRLAVERHEHDLKHGAERGLRFDWKRGQHVVDFFHGFLRHWKGEWAGERVELQPWQQWQLIVLYGWLRDNGLRRFNHAYLEEARKNGKSFKAAGLALYAMDAEGEPGAEVFAAATKREQVTEYVWKDAWKMVAASEPLKARIQRFRSSATLVCEETGSKFTALGADEDTLDALNVHMGIIDELHAHRTRGIYDKLETGMGARREPLLLVITTAGDETPDSPYEQVHGYARKVLEGFGSGFIDDQFFAFIACLDDGDDPFDEAVWCKANPNIGVSVKVDFLRSQAVKAKNDPTFLPAFLRYHCNVRASSSVAWITPEEWDACYDPDLRGADLDGRQVFGGLDLATTTDLAAFADLFPEPDGSVLLRCVAWCPEDGIARRAREDNARYLDWAIDRWLVPTPGNIIDYQFITDRILGAAARYVYREIGFDRAKAADVCMRLTDAGLPMVEVQQGPVAMTAPLNRFQDLARARKLRHDGNPVLRWCIGNALVKDAAGGLKRLTKASSRSRIDCAAAALDAMACHMRTPGDGYAGYQAGDLFVVEAP